MLTGVVATACGGADMLERQTRATGSIAGPGTTGPSGSAAPAVPVGFALCKDVPRPYAPSGWYRPTPVYVGNEQPTQAVKAWAEKQPGYAGVWLDRDHNGWITLAFTKGTGDIEVRQRELEATLPEVGVVAVEVAWTEPALEDLRRRVTETLTARGWSISTGIPIDRGVVSVYLGVLSKERLDALGPFAGERICVEGADPSTEVPAGSQPRGGDGWRLLGDGLVGQAYRTGVATTDAQYAALWTTAGMVGERPAVNFDTAIVVWLGAVYGSSCPIRLDGVVVDRDRRVLFGKIVVPGNPAMCTDDARPHAYVVSVERATLPQGPFAVQLGASDPPRGVPEERTLVSVDLSSPGTVAADTQIGADPKLVGEVDRLGIVGTGATVSLNDPWRYRIPAGCGAKVLGIVNGVLWETDGLGDTPTLPPEWHAIADVAGDAVVEVTLAAAPPKLMASANGLTLTYRSSALDRAAVPCASPPAP